MGFTETLTEIFKGSRSESLTLIAQFNCALRRQEREGVGGLHVHMGQEKNNRSTKIIRSTPSYHPHLHIQSQMHSSYWSPTSSPTTKKLERGCLSSSFTREKTVASSQ